ncbi:high mobility group B protein 14-like isoform X2 [Hibiscus syriacus]|uniref:high mobility group B protein 14-like isoform X2 n=1 Tax=Hibiscus syriacus TaxID=106335 RepID=UPI0019233E99|nr:high mobility group B protein 14-like isoform X2 [Hibiscus syriacus]
MAKKASNSKNDGSSSTSATSAKSPPTASNYQMALRVKSSDKMKKIAQGSVVSVRETRPKSKSRLKSKQQQQKKKTTKFDAKMPKKPPTAFFYFLEDFRKEFQEQNPDIKSMRDIGKACGEKWKTMTYEEKVKYYDIATEKRAEFDRAMAEYNKRKESGEDEETEDDSDYEE